MSRNVLQDLRHQHTIGHINCPVCAEAKIQMIQSLSQEQTFPIAFAVWLSKRVIETHGIRTDASYISRKTERDYRVCAKALSQFFGRLKLAEIHSGHLAVYQQARALNETDPEGVWRCFRKGIARHAFGSQEQAEAWAARRGPEWTVDQTLWAARAGANCIRKEIALLMRVLKAAGCWTEDDVKGFDRLRAVESDLRRAMTIEEQHRFMHVAASRAEFRFIYQYALVALQTTAATNEMRALRLGDVHLADKIIRIPRAGAKNKYRQRTIPIITDDAMWALEGLVERAREMGATSPSDYLFPRQLHRGVYDPAVPMSESGLKKPWDALRRAAGMPALRLYDLRHTGITRMAEAGVPLPVAMTFAGHMTLKSQQHYQAVCMAAQRGWGAQVWGAGVVKSATAQAVRGGDPAVSAPRCLAPKPPARDEAPLPYRVRHRFH